MSATSDQRVLGPHTRGLPLLDTLRSPVVRGGPRSVGDLISTDAGPIVIGGLRKIRWLASAPADTAQVLHVRRRRPGTWSWWCCGPRSAAASRSGRVSGPR